MKKFALFSILAFGLGLASCDNDFDFPNPPGQSNPQEPVLEAPELQLSNVAGTATIDLPAVIATDGMVRLAEVLSFDGLEEDYDFYFIGQMAASEAFNNAKDFETVMDGNTITANPDVLEAIYHEALNTIDPAARTTYIRFKAYAKNATSHFRIGGTDTYYGQMTASMKPFAPDFTVEEKYYLIGTPTDGAIDAAKAIEMHNSGISSYDDPVFTCTYDISAAEAAAGFEWAVVPQSTLVAGTGLVLAPADSEHAEDAEGFFKDSTLGSFAIVREDNTHLFTVNVKADDLGLYEYSCKLAIKNLYTPGPSNNWSPATSQMLYTDNYTTYQGFVNIENEFKFTSAPDWNHTNYGYAEDGKLTTDGSAGNIPVTVNGLYWANANIAALTYSLTNVTTLGLIGDATPGGWDASTALTPSADNLTWTATVDMKGGEYKIRANDAWDIDFGGSNDDLIFKGGNIPSPGEGKYLVTLNLASLPYTISFTKQ